VNTTTFKQGLKCVRVLRMVPFTRARASIRRRRQVRDRSVGRWPSDSLLSKGGSQQVAQRRERVSSGGFGWTVRLLSASRKRVDLSKHPRAHVFGLLARRAAVLAPNDRSDRPLAWKTIVLSLILLANLKLIDLVNQHY
jgi:hypothetical protein